jgi:hypothetical protein
MKTTEQLVQELLDREAIRDLHKRYCNCLWTSDLPVDKAIKNKQLPPAVGS